MLRHQLPVYSPVTTAAIWAAISHGLGWWRGKRHTAHAAPDQLARLLADTYAADRVLLFDSGTGALQAALGTALRQSGGQTVVLPAYTCFDVAAAAVAIGARIRLYDLDPHSLSPDLDSLKRAVDHGRCAVVIAPLYGMPVHWDCITEVVNAAGGIVVEDAAQGHGATWRNRPLGSLGTMSVISFGRGKGWTGGSGGAVLLRVGESGVNGTGSAKPAVLREEVRVGATLLAQWVMGRPGLYGLPRRIPWLHLGETVYRDARAPRAITRAACASINALRMAAGREARARQTNAAVLLDAIRTAPHVSPIEPHPHSVPGYLRLPILLARGLDGFAHPRRAIELGVAPSYPRVLSDLIPVQPLLDEPGGPWPGAEQLRRMLFTLPTHSKMRVAERIEMIRLLQQYHA